MIRTLNGNEAIDSIVEKKSEKTVTVIVNFIVDNTIVGNKSYSITGTKYDLLMSQSPEFSPNKPLNEYREVDLWYMIDQIRNEEII